MGALFFERGKQWKKDKREEEQRAGMAAWYVNSRTAPWLWHHFQMVCQLSCHAQIFAWPWSANITCVDARTLCPVGKCAVWPDCTLISTTHPVISAQLLTLHFPTGSEFALFSLLFTVWIFVLCPVRSLFKKNRATKLDFIILMVNHWLAKLNW